MLWTLSVSLSLIFLCLLCLMKSSVTAAKPSERHSETVFVSSIGDGFVSDVRCAVEEHDTATRPLSGAEIAALKANGCASQNWAAVTVRKEAGRDTLDTACVQRCTFVGAVSIGPFRSSDVVDVSGTPLPVGVYDCTLDTVSVSCSAVVRGCTLVSNTLVSADVAVLNCGSVLCSGPTAFGNGMELPLGLDGSGRLTRVYASMTVPEAADLATHSWPDAKADSYSAFVDGLVSDVTYDSNVLCRGVRVMNCTRVVDVLALPFARMEGVTVERATLLSDSTDPTVVEGGAVVRDALLQWGSHVDSMGCVEQAVMCERSHVDRHGKLLESLLGPLSGVSEGEVSASLVGPLVGFHHQALLIAALWPEGKGNVGYGANVGSNHTGKLPDQEIRPGEGTFFGLGTCVKFPANYQASPYTIIATGVCALPQRMEFPFSLVNTPGQSIAGLSPAINELTPGWVLSDSVYTVWRNQHKFEARCNSRRHYVPTAIFRPEIVDMLISARARLMAVPETGARFKDARGNPVWTDREIKGAGKNYVTEANRVAAIAGYTKYIQLYALSALGRQSTGHAGKGLRVDLCASDFATPEFGVACADTTLTAHESAVLAAEFGSVADVMGLLALYRQMMTDEAKLVMKVKAKDSKRGARIIPDYDEVHPSADRDKVVQWMKNKAIVTVMKPKL